ncbi:MAG: cytochrome c-type bioproteinis protein CcmE [Gammaproteobacteria bacterium]|nr:MAG: cytochrome c-type bioproteinis protein CcmE [Gammaproteobacteria bacterium]TND06211.1 MAG: cytochrome c-type bioproteinis protein CcmE [Gammaproteobacteria bacterium]
MKPRHKRLIFIAGGIGGLAVATTLVLNALNSNIALFFSPSQVLAKEAPVDKAFRLGGLVREGSLQRENDGLTVHFVVTDTAKDIKVTYTGILPDLFREGQGVVTQGRLGDDGGFRATEVLAKHDETYMPPEVADALAKAKTNTAAGEAALPMQAP